MFLPNMDQQKGMKESGKINCFIGPFRALGYNTLKHHVFSQHGSGLLIEPKVRVNSCFS